ncbi:MAG: cytochrome c-type biogenesis CcmF C-terminal domain-containing protein, partial [Acidimicrobiales bacterium]
IATLALVRALVTDDFSLTYVADFSREGSGAPYRVAALWGGMAGSLLWFAALVGGAGLVAAWRVPADGAGDSRRSSAMVMRGVTGGLVAVLAGLVLAFADPFRRLEVPAIGGAGLAPILEHPAMLYHPPLLYLGLATLVGPFALTIAALGRGSDRLDERWAATTRAWSLVPWTLLAVGMVAGAHWAYVELGWGGFWAWDPVENTALLPWLAVTLFLHAARRASLGGPSRAGSRVGLAGLACLPFVLALLGALLTRSGATSSVHAFAESQAIGRALGGVVAGVAVGVVVLLARTARAPSSVTAEPAGIRGGLALPGARLSVPDLLAGHLAVVGAVLAVVLAGTVWPLWTDLTGGNGIAIEGRYFSSFAGPLAVAGLLLLGALSAVQSRRGTADRAMTDRAMTGAALSGGGAALAALIAAGGHVDGPAVVLAVLAGVVVGTGLLAATRRTSGRIGAHLAHAGLGLLLVGIAGTTTGETTTVPVAPGETVEVAGRRVTFDGVAVVNGPVDGPVDGSSAVVADVDVDGRRLAPSIVAFPERSVLLPETSLVSGPLADVQVALRDAHDDGSALLDVGVHPLQVLVWWGALVLVAGGALSGWEATARRASDRRPSRTDTPAEALASRA